MSTFITCKITWADNSTGANDETGQEIQIFTDSPSFRPDVPVDYLGASHAWMQLQPIAAGVTEASFRLETPVTFIKFRVRQYNAQGNGDWDNPVGTVFQITQPAGAARPQAPSNPGFVVTDGGSVTTPPPVTPPPPPPPTGGGGSGSNYDFATQFSGVQGQNQWSYRDTLGNNLTYSSANNLWSGAQAYQNAWAGGVHPGTSAGTVIRWTAPTGGTAIVTGSVALSGLGGNGVTFTMKHGATDLDGPVSLTTTAVRALSETVVMLSGEYIDFIVDPNGTNSYDSTSLLPLIQFTTDGSTPAPPALSTLSPATIALAVGGVDSLTVTLSSAPLSAAAVTASSSDPTKVTVPATAAVSAGQTSALLPITRIAAGASTITASYGGVQKTSVVTVANPPSGSWSNAPLGGVVLLDHAFNSVTAPNLTTPWNNTFIVQDGSAPFSGPNVARTRLEAFATTGGDELTYQSPTPYREMYMGVYWRTNPQFQGRISSNKTFFLRGVPGTNGVIYMVGGPNMSQANFSMVWSHNGGNLNNGHIMGGDAFGSAAVANVGNAVVIPGLWYKLELHIRASTTASSRDGFMRMWLNGTQTHNYDQLNYASSTATASSPGFLNQWVWNETWDGSGDMGVSNTVPWEHYVDHVYIVGKN